MKIVVFGLSISSAWGNGHATLLRGLFRAMNGMGHNVEFFERDTPYYARNRDATSFPFVQLNLYSDWDAAVPQARKSLSGADCAIVTSYCPDGVFACDLVLESNVPRKLFYDMDTGVTLTRFENGERIEYLPSGGLGGFDLALSYTGGKALDLLRTRLGARHVAPLYGWVDTSIHHPVAESERFLGALSYLGTYASDRNAAFDSLLLKPARELSDRTFVVGGAMYPHPEAWPSNVHHHEHVSPSEHPAFYCSSPLTLSITRGAMAACGYCPSGRLFEAAACGTAVLSDWWEGLDTFFKPGEEILIARSTADSISAITEDVRTLRRIGRRAGERVLECHTAEIRARRLTSLIEFPSDESGDPEGAVVVERA